MLEILNSAPKISVYGLFEMNFALLPKVHSQFIQLILLE